MTNAQGPYRGRFAPSPTGSLHLGNARTALLAWLRARSLRGQFLVRVEDLDGPRTRAEAVTGNLTELRWLGIDWDEGPDVGGSRGPYVQSLRGEQYAEALATLTAQGSVFPCYLSRKDLAEAASAPHDSSEERSYGLNERLLSQSLASDKQLRGVKPSLRFEVPDGEVTVLDACGGSLSLGLRDAVGHFVLRRSDGLWAYQLAVVVDDAAMGITEVVRGRDLLRSTASQLALYSALGYSAPAFHHVGLVTDEAGNRLAKRAGATSLSELRSGGVRPERVVGLLAHLSRLTPALCEISAMDLLASLSDDNPASSPLGCADARLTATHLAWLLG